MCNSLKHLFVILIFNYFLCIANDGYSITKEKDINQDNYDQTVNYLEINDPFENLNRKIFFFNAVIWHTVVIPFGRVYVKLPIELRNTFANYGNNYITEPTNMLYSVFDLDFEAIAVSFWRFTTNTIFGAFGTFDVAEDLNLHAYKKNLGDVLYFYHIPRGPYLMLPIMGPSTTRDFFGNLIAYFATSYFYMHFLIHDWAYMFCYQYMFNPFYIPFHNSGDIIWIGFGWQVFSWINELGQQGIRMALMSLENDPYITSRDDYYRYLSARETTYLHNRLQGIAPRTNICDYDAMIVLPEECKEDPKEYAIGVK